MVLETAEERNRLLRAGMQGKNIEQLYIKMNKIRVINVNILPACNVTGQGRIFLDGSGITTEGCLHGKCKDCTEEHNSRF